MFAIIFPTIKSKAQLMIINISDLLILKQLGFEWPRIDADIFNEYIKNNYGFLSC